MADPITCLSPVHLNLMPMPIVCHISLYALDIDTSLIPVHLPIPPFHKGLYTFLEIVEEQL